MERKIETSALLEVAEVELVYRSKVKMSQRPKIMRSNDAYEIIKSTWDMDKIELNEQMKAILLNRDRRVLGIFHVSSGGITGTIGDPRLIFAAALKATAVSIILVHNHPSGTLQPSRNDIEMTTNIAQAGKFLDINLDDHLIITKEGYLSMADEGLL